MFACAQGRLPEEKGVKLMRKKQACLKPLGLWQAFLLY
jgi:hypothetical protein